MPSRRTQETIEPDDGLTAETAVQLMRTAPPLSDPNDATDEEFALMERMQGLLAENDPIRVRLRLYRLMDGPQKKYEWCEDYTPQEYEDGGMSMVRDKWGPGTYQLRLNGPRGLAKVLPFQIAPDPEKKETPQVVAQVAPQNSELAQVLGAIAAGQQKIVEALAVKPDPMAQMTQMIALAGAMRQAFAPAETAKPAGDPMAMVSQVFSMVREAKSAVKELVEDEKTPADPDNPMAMLSDIVGLVKNATQQPPQQPAYPALPLQPLALPPSVIHHGQQNPTPELPQSQIAEAAPEPTQQTEQEIMAELMVKGLLEDLCEMAARGAPASEGGEFIYEKMPDDMLQYMQHRYWFELVAMRFQFVKPHEKWLREAKAEADKIFASPPDDEDHGPNP